MRNCEVADQAGQQRDAVDDVKRPEVAFSQAPVFLGLNLKLMLMNIVACCNQFMLADAERGADGGDKGNIGVGNAALPFGNSRFRNIKLLRKFPLSQPPLFAFG